MPQGRALGPWPEHFADVGMGFEVERSNEKVPIKELCPAGIWVWGAQNGGPRLSTVGDTTAREGLF